MTSPYLTYAQDPAAGGCEFDRFLHVTPKDLVLGGLYKPIAISHYPDGHEHIAFAEICKASTSLLTTS